MMRTFKEASQLYVSEHNSKKLEQPERRLNALIAIESKLKDNFPMALEDNNLFSNISRPYFEKLYELLKGSALSSAEKTVIIGLYEFSK